MALNARVTNLAKQCMAQCKRNYGVSAVLMQKSLDPIQQLFVDKIREYAQKSKSKSEMFVDADPSINKEYDDELKKVAHQYGGTSAADMTEFPKFEFQDPTLDPINLEQKK
ncbi:ATP synthase-coupling factor 6, mitochondrial [Rhipicephalus sanguineus]|uniref:ATP synthase-coupling factor 6, mitochondrial n=1 Tax=Rhipicephalus sanguineus TaxID=34632 RepID=UPI0018960527|nr:ATP synthase-coupling factor 6, mitochondrial [Rhipicephalus sanguineus]